MRVIRPRTIPDMGIFLAERVPELGNDEHCIAALQAAGVAQDYATSRLEAARTAARTARAAAAELWSLTLWK
jgi:hypothetical protein